MARRSEVSLHSFFVFNSTFGPREGEEHKKILYFHPQNVALDTQISNIGLCEAVLKFTQTFTDVPSESLHTQKTRQLFFQPEADFCMVMVINIPCVERVQDGRTVAGVDYLEDDIQDHIYQAVLRQSYNTFRLFNGTFQYILLKSDVNGLKQRLEYFFNKYLPSMMIRQADIIDTFNGIQFLPLDKNTYLRVQCFINQLEAAFPEITYTVLVYSDQLVWSGLEQEDIRVLYHYLITGLFPTVAQLEQTTSTAPRCRFLLGPPNLMDDTNLGKIPKVHLNSADESEECYLLVYRVHAATICLLVNGDFRVTFDFCKKLDRHLQNHMGALASDIADNSSKKYQGVNETQFKYVYFNRMNLAQKTSMHSAAGLPVSTVPPDVLRLVADVNYDLNAFTDTDDGELMVKTSTDFWVIGKKCDQREVYIVVNQKNANLIEINEEVKKICSVHFGNIFFLE